jgi:ABC-type lipoprotein export system ATPase subunit
MKFSALAKKLKVTQKKLNQFLKEQIEIEETFIGNSEIESRMVLFIEKLFERLNPDPAIIKCVEIRGLFSLNKSHLFRINLSKSKPIAVIHGNNGAGKTTALKIINALFGSSEQRESFLHSIPFCSVQISFEKENAKLCVEKNEDSGLIYSFGGEAKPIDEELYEEVTREFKLIGSTSIQLRKHRRAINANWAQRTYPGTLRYEIQPELDNVILVKVNSEGEPIAEMGEQIPLNSFLNEESKLLKREGPRSGIFERKLSAIENIRKLLHNKLPEEIRNIFYRTKVHMIGTNRLSVAQDENLSSEVRYQEYVEQIEDNLRKDFTESYNEYSRELAKVGQQTLAEIIKQINKKKDLNKKEKNEYDKICEQLSKLLKKSKKLEDYGLPYEQKELEELLAQGRPVPNPALYHLLKYQLTILKGALERFDRFHTPLEIFLNLINKKLEESGKLIKIIPDKTEYYRKGIKNVGLKVCRMESDTSTSPLLSLRDLSSGEQHLLVQIYRLIYETKSGSLLLIDEPEISMHLNWQEEYIDDLRKILSQNNDCRVIISTHSLDIASSCDENLVDILN